MNLLAQIWQSETLRKKVFYTILILVVYRILVQISVPGVDIDGVREFFTSGENSVFSMYSMLTGGAMEKFSILMMGLAPYINASIIMQLMTVVVPKLESLQKEGDAGQKKINFYTRILTVIFAIGQSYGVLYYIGSNIPSVNLGNIYDVLPLMLVITAGTMLLVWLGEQITEKGLGNGISLIIFASIVSNIPTIFSNILGSVGSITGDTGKLIPFVVFLALVIVLVILTILATEGQRRIPVNYGTGGQSMASNLPIRVLQAGMIPIIFALSLVTFPSVILQMVQPENSPVADFITQNLNPASSSPYFFAIYTALIVFFSYFYVSIVFKTEEIAENIQKRGGFIPGYRPGRETAEHLSDVSFRLNLWGGLFLAFVAIIPMVFTLFSGTLTSQDLIVSGSGIIIIVGVVLDLIRRINDQLVTQDYDKLK
ncbi:TPA: preprotein translocase subunit SecY [Candidatus Peregrinibacteria bacterium]|nr:preprotein translocase subunit SecY [Candidatus Peregrinibacteria bacterium]HIQ57339.1 preprotein translocase subunit SecY [Candidatus Gracilibacteria bacterium]